MLVRARECPGPAPCAGSSPTGAQARAIEGSLHVKTPEPPDNVTDGLYTAVEPDGRVKFIMARRRKAVANITGREPFATLDGVRMAKYRMFFASTKAEQELGYRSRPYVEGIEGALRWFRDAGYLRS